MKWKDQCRALEQLVGVKTTITAAHGGDYVAVLMMQDHRMVYREFYVPWGTECIKKELIESMKYIAEFVLDGTRTEN